MARNWEPNMFNARTTNRDKLIIDATVGGPAIYLDNHSFIQLEG
jgi:hypothetical protein